MNENIGYVIRHRQAGMNNWLAICNFLSSEENKFMRPNVCVGCGFVMLYDKNDKKYRIHKSFTREKVDEIITLIKAINERP